MTRVEIQPAGLLLTGLGATRQLQATAYDALGNAVAVPIAWTSTAPGDVSVDSTGKVSATVANGSTQIIAEAQTVKSAPLLVVVTNLPAGAVTVTDAQIEGDPIETDPAAAPSLDNTYRVTLRGTSAPAIGALLINTESKPVAGRVVGVETSGSQIIVTLGLVSIREAYPDLNIDQVIDLSNAPVAINPQFVAAYDVQRTGSTFTFTPKANARVPLLDGSTRGNRAITVGPSVPPFTECKTEMTGVTSAPIQFASPPLLSVVENLGIQFVNRPETGLERLVVTGDVTAKIEGPFTITAAFEGKYECTDELVTLRIPWPGFLAPFLASLVPIRLGFDVGGKVTVGSVSYALKAEYKETGEFGISCPGGANCQFVRSLDGAGTSPPARWEPDSLLGGIRFEPSVGGFVRVSLRFGNPLVRRLQFSAFDIQAGLRVAASFAPRATQIADTNYKSDYKLSLESKAGAASELQSALGLIGIANFTLLDLTGNLVITTSPGIGTVGSVSADRTTFGPGDTVNFTVKLDPSTVNFTPGDSTSYQVKRISLVRGNSLDPPEVASVTPSPGQTDFTIPFTAPDSGAATEFTAFVVTTILPFDVFSLELGVPAPPTPIGPGKLAFERMTPPDFRTNIFTMNPDRTGELQVTHAATNSRSPAWSPDAKRIAFEMVGVGIHVMNADGTGVSQLPTTANGDRSPAWSSDGARIAFLRVFDIHVMNSDGTGMAPLILPFGVSDFAWSPDDSRFVLVRRTSVVGEAADLFLVNADGSGLTNLTNFPPCLDTGCSGRGAPSWSPDGSQIAMGCGFSMDEPPFTFVSQICILDLNGGGLRVVAEALEKGSAFVDVAWSPDGSRLVVDQRVDFQDRLFIMQADGTAKTQITFGPGPETSPAWSR